MPLLPINIRGRLPLAMIVMALFAVTSVDSFYSGFEAQLSCRECYRQYGLAECQRRLLCEKPVEELDDDSDSSEEKVISSHVREIMKGGLGTIEDDDVSCKDCRLVFSQALCVKWSFCSPDAAAIPEYFDKDDVDDDDSTEDEKILIEKNTVVEEKEYDEKPDYDEQSYREEVLEENFDKMTCDQCQNFFTSMRDAVDQDAFRKDSEKFLDKELCGRMGEFKKICYLWSALLLRNVFQNLDKELADPRAICVQAHLCTPQTAKYPTRLQRLFKYRTSDEVF